MTKEQIENEAYDFFDFPTDDHSTVSYTSCLLFAKLIADKAIEELFKEKNKNFV